MINNLLNFFGIHKKLLENVFTPSSAANLNYIKRTNLEKNIDKNIKQTGKQLILYGHSGGGKTTLIREALKRQKRKFIITGCLSSETLEDLIVKAFDKLNPYYVNNTSEKNSIKISSHLKSSYSGIESTLKGEVSVESNKQYQRVLPIQLTYEKLAEFLGAIDCVWVIDDFHKVKDSEKKKLAEVMKAFVDISNDYPKVKIIALGAVNSPRDIVDHTTDINQRLAEVHVPLLSSEEIKSILINGSRLLNIHLSKTLINSTVKHSNSLGSICHSLAYNYCHFSKIDKTCHIKNKILDSVFKESIKEYLNDKSDTYKKQYDKALKSRGNSYENVKLILAAFLALNEDNVTHNEILSKIQEEEENYPQGNCTSYLQKLCSSKFDEILRYDDNSGKYSFSNPFFKAYCSMKLDENSINEAKKVSDVFEMVINELIKHKKTPYDE